MSLCIIVPFLLVRHPRSYLRLHNGSSWARGSEGFSSLFTIRFSCVRKSSLVIFLCLGDPITERSASLVRSSGMFFTAGPEGGVGDAGTSTTAPATGGAAPGDPASRGPAPGGPAAPASTAGGTCSVTAAGPGTGGAVLSTTAERARAGTTKSKLGWRLWLLPACDLGPVLRIPCFISTSWQ